MATREAMGIGVARAKEVDAVFKLPTPIGRLR